MSTALEVTTQVFREQTGLPKLGIESNGFRRTDPSNLTWEVIDDLETGVDRSVWAERASDTITDDLSLLYVEALDNPVTLILSTADSVGVPDEDYAFTLTPGLPYMLGTRLLPAYGTRPALWITEVEVRLQLAGVDNRVRVGTARPQ